MSALSDAVTVPQGATVATVTVHLASGRSFRLLLRAGEETAEWAYDRPDVRAAIRHERPRVHESWRVASGEFSGHRYAARLVLPGRYLVNGATIQMAPASGMLRVSRLAFFDDVGRSAKAYVRGKRTFAWKDGRLVDDAGAEWDLLTGLRKGVKGERLRQIPATPWLIKRWKSFHPKAPVYGKP